MIQFPNCKINLGLSILSKRTDGYHALETIFYPVGLKDAIEILPSPTMSFTQSGLAIDGEATNNLCVKAYHLMQADFPTLPPIQMHLHKNIPMGAGLGGGSSDATAVLQMLNTYFKLAIPFEKLLQYAAQLGSDCPFFMYNTACHASGRGEILTPIALDLSAYSFLLIHPPISIATAKAFAAIQPHEKETSLAKLIQLPIENWKSVLVNDFEAAIFNLHPSLAAIKEYLYDQGAIYASMSGSGSSFFGIFPKGKQPPLSASLPSYRMDWV